MLRPSRLRPLPCRLALANAQGRITLGTNPQGSIYYTVGGGMAAALQEALERQVTVQPYTGSSVYLPLVADGELTLGINSSLDTGGVYRGDYGSQGGAQAAHAGAAVAAARSPSWSAPTAA